MFIHVVRAGETIWSIARAYGVPPQQVVNASRPPRVDALVPGQTILVPSTPPTDRPTIEVNAYLEPQGTDRDTMHVEQAARALTYLSIFSYQVQADGTIKEPNDAIALATAARHGLAPLLVLTNFAAGTFQADVGHAIFSDSSMGSRVIDRAVALMLEKKYKGITVDFEHLYPNDRELYNEFLRRLAQQCREKGLLVSSALAPKVSATQVGQWYEAHDYPAHGEIVDFSVLMTYEYGWSGGPPMAVAPPNLVRHVLDYAVTVMPKEKILMGMPLYGYDWTLPYVRGGPWAKTVSPQQAYVIAYDKGAVVHFDHTFQSPYFHYWDGTKEHVIWFEDALSMDAKFNLIKHYGLRGGSYWELGSSFPQNWTLLQDRFHIRKL